MRQNIKVHDSDTLMMLQFHRGLLTRNRQVKTEPSAPPIDICAYWVTLLITLTLLAVVVVR